jgi:tetratricopeptide (TPR) repeat protein
MDFVDALYFADSADKSLRAAGAAADRAAATGDRIGALCCRLHEATVRTVVQPAGAYEQLAALIDEALPVFESAADDFALHVVHWARGELAGLAARYDRQAEAMERSRVHARRTGLAHLESIRLSALGMNHWGTAPFSEVLVALDQHEAESGHDPRSSIPRAMSLAALGRCDEARGLLRQYLQACEERGSSMARAQTLSQPMVWVELWGGDPHAAVAAGKEGCRLLEQMGERGVLSTAAGNLGQALYTIGQLDEADAWAERAKELGANEDAITQMLWRQVRAKILARRGQHERALHLAKEAVAIAGNTDLLNWEGDTYLDLAEVLSLAGRPDEEATALTEALSCYERKENLVMAERTRRLAEVGS